MDATADTSTPFTRIGGAATVDQLVEAFYTRMDTMPEARAIRAMHAHDLSEMKGMLKRYLGEWLGGPPLYSREHGHPRLRMRHLGFKIGEPERDAPMQGNDCICEDCVGHLSITLITDRRDHEAAMVSAAPFRKRARRAATPRR